MGIITETFHPNVGGQQVRYLELGRELVRRGHGVSVFTIRLSPAHPQREAIDGIDVHRITDGFRYLDFPRLRRNPANILRFTWDLLMQRGKLESYDALILNIWPVLPAIVMPRMITRPSAVDWCEIRESVFWDLTYRLLSNPKALHISVSDNIRETLCRRYKLRPARTGVIESGIHFDKYECDANEKSDKTILFLGRLASHKDPLIVLAAFLRRNLGAEGYTLHFAGDGPLLAPLREAAKGNTGVHVHGPVNEECKTHLLQKASLLVLPSRREGFPRVIAEAAAAGTPTLTSNYPGNGSVHVINQYQIGWICDPSAEELGAAMGKYAQKIDAWHTASTTCKEVARTEFDWTAVVSNLVRFLEVHM